MTAANGFGDVVTYTLAAAADVAAQNGKVPPMTPVSQHHQPPPTTVPPSTTPQTTPSGSTPYSTSSPGSTPSSTGPGTTTSHHHTKPAPAQDLAAIPFLGRTLGIPLGPGGMYVVFVFGLALLGLIGVPTTYVIGRRRGRW